MVNVLITFDNDPLTDLHDFFESCADEVKQSCIDNGINYSSLFPPEMKAQKVIDAMLSHNICVISGHGDSYGIYNENKEDVVSTRTTNYNFEGKGFYSIACSCAQNLLPHLRSLGLLFFVGCEDTFRVRGDREPFVICAISGLKSFLSGNDIKQAKEIMFNTYDEQIEALDQIDPMAAKELLHFKESLVFEGGDHLVINNLK